MMSRSSSITFLVALATTSCDLSTKKAAIYSTVGGARTLIPGALQLVHWENPGMAFSLMAGWPSALRTVLLVLTAVIGIAGGFVFAVKKRVAPASAVGVGLVMGGAIGNLLDRLSHGTVTDFLYLHRGAFSWPAFNVADIAICVGVGILMLRSGADSRTAA